MNHEEYDIQCALALHLRYRSKPHTVWFHPHNKSASAREGAHAKALGVRAGVSDLILLREGVAHALELKSKRGRMSTAQEAFQDDWFCAGGQAATAYGLDDALRVLKSWGIL